jgi:hypothetical protein
MFGLGKERTKCLYGAIFDIRSESVGIAIVASDQKNAYPEILFSHRVLMRIPKKKLSPEERVRVMKEALFSASLIISRDGLEALRLHNPRAHVDKILVSCSAPWSYTISRNVTYTHEGELKITRDLIDDLIGSAEKEIQNHIDAGEVPGGLTYDIVERATVDVRINDYPVIDPIGLRGKEVSLAHVTGLIPREVMTALTEVGEKIFPNTTIRPHTFMLVLYCVIRDTFAEHNSMTIVHVTGESIELGIIEGDTLVESMSVPLGLENIIERMMDNEKDTSKEMHTLLELYMKNELSPDVKEKIHGHLSAYGEAVTAALAPHGGARRFPKTAFLLAPTPFTPLFKEILEPILKDSLGTMGTILEMKDDILNASSIHDASDINISITSRFFHKLHGCGEID